MQTETKKNLAVAGNKVAGKGGNRGGNGAKAEMPRKKKVNPELPRAAKKGQGGGGRILKKEHFGGLEPTARGVYRWPPALGCRPKKQRQVGIRCRGRKTFAGPEEIKKRKGRGARGKGGSLAQGRGQKKKTAISLDAGKRGGGGTTSI